MPNAASMAVSDGSSGGMPALVFDRYDPTSFTLAWRIVLLLYVTNGCTG